MRQHVLKQMAYTAAAALLLGWMWLVPAVGLWATMVATLVERMEPVVLVVPAPQIVTAQVAEAAEAVVSAQDKRWRIGLKGEAERNGAIERLRSMVAEWRRVRGE